MRATVGPASSQSTAPQAGEESPFDLRSALGVLRRRRWVVIATIACLMAATLLIASQLQKQYTATTLVVVDSRGSQMLGFEPGIAEGVNANSQVDTEVEIARSTKVGARAAVDLGVARWPEYASKPSLFQILKSLVGFGERVTVSSPAGGDFNALPVEEQARLVAVLMDHVRLRRLGLTSVISISATATSPETAAKIANALADAYLTEQIGAKIESNERTAAFLRTRVDGLAADINTIEAQIDTFVTTTLATLGSADAKELLIQIGEEGKQRQADSGTLSQLQDALKANDFDRLAALANEQQADLAARRQALLDQMNGTTDAMRVDEAKKKLDSLDDEIKTAAERRTADLQSDLSASEARSADMRKRVQDTISQLQLPKETSVQLFRLQSDAETRRSLYDSFLTKLRQLEQQTDFTVPDSRVIASATPPTDPSFPPTKLILAAAFLFSLGAGAGLAFLREHFVGGVTSVEQLENLAGFPVVAAVPRHHGGKTPDRPDLAIVSEPLSAFSESIRRIRLGLEPYTSKGKCVIFVTSSLPADGKTTIALTLARHMAMTGSSTLLIDADLRHPSIHRLLNEKVEGGLISFLAQGPNTTPDQVTLVTEPASGVHFVLGAEASAIATDALLMSSRFGELMAFARDKYDVVIVDTPPVGLVVDATIVARHCDMGIFVVRYASTGQHAVRATLRDLVRRVDLPILGVLNQVERGDSYQYGYGRKYRDYYQ